MLPPDTQERVAAFARTHHGLVTARAAAGAGATRAVVEAHVARGLWIPLAKGVYASATAPPTWKQRVMAAVLSVGEGAIRARTAAVLHGLGMFSPPDVPEVVTYHTGSSRSRIARVMRSQKYPVMARIRIDNIPVLTPVEMIFNMAGRTSTRRLERLVDEVLVRRMGTADELAEVLDRYEGTRLKGIRRLRPIVLDRVADGAVPNESELEFLLDEVLDHPRVPTVIRQHRAPWMDAGARVDRWIPLWRIVVEADGRSWHTRSADFERDRARDNAAAAAGVLVLRFTYRMLTEQPHRCVQQLIEAGSQREGS